MKKLIAFIFLLPLLAMTPDPQLAKIFPLKEGMVYYEKIIDINGATKSDLYKRAKAWISTHQPVKDAAVQEDQEQGLHSSNIHFSNLFAMKVPLQRDSLKSEWHYWYNIRIYVKDNKAKIVADNLRFGGSETTNHSKVEDYKEYCESIFSMFPGMKKTKERYYQSVYQNFDKANHKIISDIEDIEKTLREGNKSEADF